MRYLLGLFVALLLAGAAQAGVLKLEPTSDYGVIAIEVEPGGPMASANGGYRLNIGAFSPEAHAFNANPFGGWASLGVLGKTPTAGGYYLAKAKPGAYALLGLSVKNWGVCYNGDSQTFEVKPGQVTFLGRYDPQPSLIDLSLAVQSGRLSSVARGTDVLYIFDTPRLALTPPAQLESWRPALEDWLKAEKPDVQAPVVVADLTPTHFNTGRDAFGLQRICGGYYAKHDKGAGPQAEKAPSP